MLPLALTTAHEVVAAPPAGPAGPAGLPLTHGPAGPAGPCVSWPALKLLARSDPRRTFAAVTAPLRNCAVPTLLVGNTAETAAALVPASATNSAIAASAGWGGAVPSASPTHRVSPFLSCHPG